MLDSIGIVTYLNPVIGHHNGDLVGRECARSGRSVREVVLEMGLLEESVLDEILSPENLLRPHFRDLNVYSGSDPSTPPVVSTAPGSQEYGGIGLPRVGGRPAACCTASPTSEGCFQLCRERHHEKERQERTTGA